MYSENKVHKSFEQKNHTGSKIQQKYLYNQEDVIDTQSYTLQSQNVQTYPHRNYDKHDTKDVYLNNNPNYAKNGYCQPGNERLYDDYGCSYNNVYPQQID